MKLLSMRFCATTLMLLLGAGLACCSDRKANLARPAAQLSVAELEHEIGYPRASWRIDPSRTNAVRLGLAHILIAHSEAISARLGAPFVANKSQRSREQALRMAVDIARQLESKPTAFAALAARSSDDRASNEVGGVLGIVAVAGLPPAILDAISVLKVAQISRVIETDYGFHILKRLPVPNEQRLAGRRILLQHQEVAAERRHGQDGVRTRQEALALARTLHAKLAQDPGQFVTLAREHSDAVEGSSDGEIGVWSSYEGSERGMNGWFIAQLEVGAVSEVIETPSGYQIYQRSAPPAREPLAVRFIRIGPDTVEGDAAIPTPELNAKVRKLASRVAADLAKDPSRFEAEQAKYCPKETDCSTQIWSLARGQNQLQHVNIAEQLKVGQVSAQPVSMDAAFLILRREDPATVPELADHYELEMPNVPFLSLEERLQSLDGFALSRATRELLETAEGRLDLASAERKAFRSLFNELANALRTAPATQRAELIGQHQARVFMLIGPEKMAILHDLRETQWRNAQLM